MSTPPPKVTLPPLPSLQDMPPPRVGIRCHPFVWCDGLLVTPWERSSRTKQLTIEQEQTVAVVAKAALSLRHGGAKPSGQNDHLIWWIAASGEVISSDTVPAAWWRARVFRYLTLEIERTQP
jgi:hypothetical protein